jgi:hypothetical protein
MEPKTLAHTMPLNGARSHVFFTDLQLQMFPVTQVYVPTTEQLLLEYPEIAAKEIAHSDAVDKARVAILISDVGLNHFADKVSTTVFSLVKSDRAHPLYRLLCSNVQCLAHSFTPCANGT